MREREKKRENQNESVLIYCSFQWKDLFFFALTDYYSISASVLSMKLVEFFINIGLGCHHNQCE